jgi:hypothetical protein
VRARSVEHLFQLLFMSGFYALKTSIHLRFFFCGGKVLSSDHIDFVEACGALATLVQG